MSDAEWAVIRPLLPNMPRGVARVDDRPVINGILYVPRTGSLWRDLPERYGPYTTVYIASIGGLARCLGQIFRGLGGKISQIMALIDSSIIRAHQRVGLARPSASVEPAGRFRPPHLLAGLNCRDVVVDRGYGADALLALIRARAPRRTSINAKPPVERTVNRRIYRQRNLVERYFNKQALSTHCHALRAKDAKSAKNLRDMFLAI